GAVARSLDEALRDGERRVRLGAARAAVAAGTAVATAAVDQAAEEAVVAVVPVVVTVTAAVLVPVLVAVLAVRDVHQVDVGRLLAVQSAVHHVAPDRARYGTTEHLVVRDAADGDVLHLPLVGGVADPDGAGHVRRVAHAA